MKDGRIDDVMKTLKREVRRWDEPVMEKVSAGKRDPYRVLISCILSLRTKDEVTGPASRRLFAVAPDPEALSSLPVSRIEKLIYPVGFYRNKAGQIREIARSLVSEHAGLVPDTIDGLLAFKGVGRKTANLVMTNGHGKYGICVDIHVHRITNRWGYVQTGKPDETEFALRDKLPRRWWRSINRILVTYGQNLCKPVSPFCSECVMVGDCARVGVERSR